MLTGESLPADKHASAAADHANETGPDAPHLVFLGTSVVSGTGDRHRHGHRSAHTCSATSRRDWARARPRREFEHGLRRFSLLILRTTVVLVLFIVLVGIALKRDPFESLLFAVALGRGSDARVPADDRFDHADAGRAAHGARQVIVKHLPAIQNFGSIDMLCSDKTGTLDDWRDATRSGARRRRRRRRRVRSSLAYVNSQFETGIRSPLDAAILQHDSDGHHRVSQGRRDSVRLRAPPVVGGGRAAGRRRPTPAHRQGRTRRDPRDRRPRCEIAR